MNNKGFMMAEVVVVAAVILVAFSFFYINYNNLISLNNERIAYYDVATLYKLSSIIKNNRNDIIISSRTDKFTTQHYVELTGLATMESGERIFLLNHETFLTNSHNKLIENETINKTFEKYLKYLSQSNEVESGYYILVMEKCGKDKKGNYTMDCKYAYLETVV